MYLIDFRPLILKAIVSQNFVKTPQSEPVFWRFLRIYCAKRIPNGHLVSYNHIN